MKDIDDLLDLGKSTIHNKAISRFVWYIKEILTTINTLIIGGTR